jgi:malonyl-CoA O-methyltransferase
MSTQVKNNEAVLLNAVGEQMLARLEWMVLAPQTIADVGCGIGQSATLLRQRYPEATVAVCDEAQRLPFLDHSVDLIFANLVLPWCHDPNAILAEWRRVLRPEGLLIFSCLGPDTLGEWQADFATRIIPRFIDMHDVGDALTQAKWMDPVLDVDYITLNYRRAEDFFHELQAMKMLNTQAVVTDKKPWEATYEIIFGHAWCPHPRVDQVADEFGTVRIPLSHLRVNVRS